MASVVAATALAAAMAGCKETADWFKTDMTRFLSPDKVLRPPEGSPVNPILGSIGPTDRAQELVPNATFPREGDWEYRAEDYVIGPTDIVDISILDLFAEGLETVLRRQVSESGFVDLPLLPERIKAEGYTQDELREMIADAYSPAILKEPTVSVSVAARRQNTFSILGSVARPGSYNVLRPDMRLLEALALAGGITQTNIQYVYVIRPKPATRIEVRRPGVRPGRPLPPLPPLPPEVPGPTTGPATHPVSPEEALKELSRALPGTAPATQPSGPTQPALPAALRLAVMDGQGPATTSTAPAEDPELRRAAQPGRWVYSAGKWVRATAEAAETAPATKATEGREASDPFGWRKVDRSDMARIVAINLRQLRDGNPRMNVVIHDNDIIEVPMLEVGEFYVMGEVLRPGVYSLTGRQITVKMAVAAAGNLGPLAWPENSILIRRVGDRQEQVIPLNLEAIFRGEDPDVFLKANDVIAVGTDVRTAFFAVVRSAFRMTYGFGFIYDRNFADPLVVTPTNRRFTRL